jgi:signal transduction histidine kinase
MAQSGLAAQAAQQDQDLQRVPVPARSRRTEADVKQWLARELHDSVAQTLTGMIIEIERFKSEQLGQNAVLAELEVLQDASRRVLASLRSTMRELREEPRDVLLSEWLTQLLQEFSEETGIATRLTGVESWPPHLSTHAAINVSRIVEEALRNVRNHSAAACVLVAFDGGDGLASMRIQDDGRGAVRAPKSMSWLRMGTLGMKERATLLGGDLELTFTPGQGTTVILTLPMEALT